MWSALNAATRDYHAAVDAPWTTLLRADVTPYGYQSLLVQAYGFEAPVEAALALTPALSRMIDLRGRARSSWIIQDLLALGLRPAKLARLPQCTDVVPFRDVAEALGWLYVVERSTMHHRALAARIAAVLPAAPLTYLTADGYDDRRTDVGFAFDEIAADPVQRDRVIAAAREALEIQRDWLEADVRVSSPNLSAMR
jgi:heme oxygenase